VMEIAERDRVLDRSSEATRHLARMAGDDRFQAVFGFRCGYARSSAPPSPRRGVEAVLIL